MAKIAKRTAAARKAFEGKANLAVAEAVALVKANATAKFDETLEIAMNLGVDPRHADQMVRGVVNLPNGTGKTVRVAVFARGAKAEEAQAAGADIVGAEDLMETIQGGKIEFDRCIATPDMMPIVGRLGKILGPRNLMPNPKVGTVTMDVAQAVKNAKGGEVQFKVEKAGVIHGGVGKASFDEAKLVENVKAFVQAVNRAKPSRRQGHLPEEDRALARPWDRACRSTWRARSRNDEIPRGDPGMFRAGEPPDCPRRWVGRETGVNPARDGERSGSAGGSPPGDFGGTRKRTRDAGTTGETEPAPRGRPRGAKLGATLWIEPRRKAWSGNSARSSRTLVSSWSRTTRASRLPR